MEGPERFNSVHAIVERMHARGILLYILGLEEMRRRTWAIAVRYNNGDPTAPVTFRAFVYSCYHEGYRRPHVPLVSNAIAFYARPTYPPTASRAHTYPSESGQQWYILDVETTSLSLIIPLGVYVPYSTSQHRTTITLANVDPVPMWVMNEGRLGIRLSSNELVSLQHGHRLFLRTNGSTRTTVFVKIEWPGYHEWRVQIRLGDSGLGDSGRQQTGGSYTFTRLVHQVRSKVCRFISDHADVVSRDPHWAVGHTHGRITTQDLVLLAIVVVSQGVVMPILKLRDDFVFADSSSTRVAASAAMAPAASGTHGTRSTPIINVPYGALRPNVSHHAGRPLD